MNYAHVVDICCRDLRRYLETALKTARGGVVTVKMRRLLWAELSPSDRARYSRCLSNILRQWRWGGSYVIPRQDAEELLESFDELCQSAKATQYKKSKQKEERRREGLVLISFLLPEDLLRAVDAYAQHMNMSRSEVIRSAVQQLIDLKHVLEEINKARFGRLERVALRLPSDLLDALSRYCATLKVPRSALVRYAIMRMLRRIHATQNATPLQAAP